MDLSASLKALVQQQISEFDLPEAFVQSVQQILLPLAGHIATRVHSSQGTSLISINGSQGSGKSTMTVFLQLLLQHQYNLTCAVLSIDDFYLTRTERQQLARRVHPLLATRGVPGTHDIELAAQTLQCLKSCCANQPCRIPVFVKSIDDRADESYWNIMNKPVDIILFEGWCNHAPLQSEAELEQPVNDLEKYEDAEGHWRSYVNQQLQQYHKRLFELADCLIFLQIPSFEKVYEWRGLQEHKLQKNTAASKPGIMNQQQLIRFIQHYERITRACLKQLPQTADIVLKLDDDHTINCMHIRGENE